MVGNDIGDKVAELRKKYKGLRIVVDPASKQLIEDLRSRFGFHMISAQKTDKKGHIGIMNSDFLLGRFKLLEGENGTDELADEYTGLIWDIKKKEVGKYVEHAACDNHLADATLYAWRYCYAYVNDPSQKTKAVASSKDIKQVEAFLDEWEQAESQKIEQNKYGGLEVDFSDDDDGW